MKLSKFLFFKNTPLVDFSNTIHFKSNQERDDFFINGGHYVTLEYTHNEVYNFIRDRGNLRASIPYAEMEGVNYCTWTSETEPQRRFYAYVRSYKYINDKVTEIELLVDPVMMYTQGNRLNLLKNINIKRQHLTTDTYFSYLDELRNNDDVLEVKTGGYFYEDLMKFEHFNIMIVSACNLYSDYGTRDNPRISSPVGMTFDGITSPLDLYIIPEANFKSFMNYFLAYPWITQNFMKIVRIPNGFINNDDVRHIDSPPSGHPLLYRPREGYYSEHDGRYNQLNKSFDDLFLIFGIDQMEEPHLLRSEYCTVEIYSWDGQKILVDLGRLDPGTGIELSFNSVFGYHNQLAIYLKNYKLAEVNQYNNNSPEYAGSYLNDSIVFDSFDDVPVLLDHGGIARANQAHQMSVQDTQAERGFTRGMITNLASLGGGLIGGPVGSALGAGAGLAVSKLSDGIGMLTGGPVGNILSMFDGRREYYENRQATEASLSLRGYSQTHASYNNALQQASGNYGLTAKYSRPSFREQREIRNYYKSRGFKWDKVGSLDNVESMSIANYVEFAGNWTFDNIDVGRQKMLQGIFESGVTLWHNNNTPNPMQQPIDNNRRVI